MLALDHYGKIVEKLGEENILESKKDILTTLGIRASAVLLDTKYGLPAYYQTNAYHQPNTNTPLIVKADPIDNLDTPAVYPEEALSYGASALKFLAESPLKQEKVITTLALESKSEKLPFILEIIPTKSEIESILTTILKWKTPISIYKLPYPGSATACQKITNLLGAIPWVMLSGGDSFETFLTNFHTAKNNGCAGFLAGRSLWQEALEISPKKREGFIIDNIIPKWEQLTNERR